MCILLLICKAFYHGRKTISFSVIFGNNQHFCINDDRFWIIFLLY